MISNKTILITGASSGIGKELAIQYSKYKDITLFLLGRNESRLKKVQNLCEDNGTRVFIKIVDINSTSEMEKTIIEFNKQYRVDLVIANAGISSSTSKIKNSTLNTYDLFNTNIFGTLNTIEPIIPIMKSNGKGHIAIISSMSSFIGMPSCPAYSASKACVATYGEALRGKLKKYNINVSVICPGFIKTPLTDKNTFPMPFLMPVDKACKKIINGINKNKGLIVFPLTIYFIIKIFSILPYGIKSYIFSKLPSNDN